MGWNRTLRSGMALARSIEREHRRSLRAQERQQKEEMKLNELNNARQDFNDYEEYINSIRSYHKKCGEVIDWGEIKLIKLPVKPKKSSKKENEAKRNLTNYKPSLLDKIFKKMEKKKADLIANVKKSKKDDTSDYNKSYSNYLINHKQWKELNKIAEGVINEDSTYYINTIEKINSFDELKKYFTFISFKVINNKMIVSTIHTFDEQIIPKESKSLLKSGKLSMKVISKIKFNELYQDYVCSMVLRIARELFALLPLEMVVINVVSKLLNTKTGHKENRLILSVAIPKETLDSLNFKSLDPSDSMNNFKHNMNFKKSLGFSFVEEINPYSFLESKKK